MEPNGLLCWARAWLYTAESYWTKLRKLSEDLDIRITVLCLVYYPHHIHQCPSCTILVSKFAFGSKINQILQPQQNIPEDDPIVSKYTVQMSKSFSFIVVVINCNYAKSATEIQWHESEH